jgi:hypothetical protein
VSDQIVDMRRTGVPICGFRQFLHKLRDPIFLRSRLRYHDVRTNMFDVPLRNIAYGQLERLGLRG